MTAKTHTDEITESRLAWIRDYADRRLCSRSMDERRCLSPSLVLDLGNQGLLGLQVEKAHGGLGLGYVQALRIVQQLAAVDLTVAMFVGMSNLLGMRPIEQFATPEMRLRWLPLLASGRALGAFALTEPGAGSNPRAMSTSARAVGSGSYVISGRKCWIGNAAWSSVLTVFAKTEDSEGRGVGLSAFVVERDAAGLGIGAEALTMGLRATAQSEVLFERVRVDARHVLGAVGAGDEVAADALSRGRLGIAALAVGTMKRCAQLVARYAVRREISTGPLIENPVIIDGLHSMICAIDAVQSLYVTVARWLDEGRSVPDEVYAACKVAGSEYAWAASDFMVQALGGRGYVETNLAPQILRDARILRIFEGPSETLVAYAGSSVLSNEGPVHRFVQDLSPGDPIWAEFSIVLDRIRGKLRSGGYPGKRAEAKSRARLHAGNLCVLGILAAAVGKGDESTRVWLKDQIERAVSLALRSHEGSTRSPGGLLSSVRGYEADIGNVDPDPPGDAQGGDPYLRRGGPET